MMNEWFKTAVGRYMNPDNAYGYQCKDVVDDYCIKLFGNWVNTIRPGNANVSFDNANPDYFIKIRNNFNDPNSFPQRGDIIVYGASRAVPEGHIAVVESANANIVNVIQQDGYAQVRAHRATLGYILPNGAQAIGWLRPRVTGDDQVIIQNAPNWRARCDKIMYQIRGRTLGDEEFLRYAVGAEFLKWVESVSDSEEANGATHWQEVGKLAITDKWDQQIYALSAQVGQSEQNAASAQLASQKAKEDLSKSRKEVDDLKAQIATQTDDTKNLNAFGVALKWFIARIGLSK